MTILQMAKTIIRNLLKGPDTLMYPFKPAKKFGNTRGRIENDMSKCILCGTCQRKCPASALCVDRNAKTWAIDRFRCVACNCCVEVCPVKSLRMENNYTSPSSEPKMRETFVSTKPSPPVPAAAPIKKQ